MALQARIVDVRPDAGDTFSFAADYYDTAEPGLVLFTSPRWALAATTDASELDALVIEYGRLRDAVEEAPSAFADHTVDVIADYAPSAARVAAVAETVAALDAEGATKPAVL